MSKKIDQRLLDTNAIVMGNGVSFAILESMFNLVQAQSVVSANMVRDQSQSNALMVSALANGCLLCGKEKETTATTTTTTNNNDSNASMEKLMMEVLEMLGEHMTEMNDANRESNSGKLTVT